MDLFCEVVKLARNLSWSRIYLLFFLITGNAVAQKYEIILNTPFHTPFGQKIYMTGDIEGVCSFDKFDCLEMREILPNSYAVTFELPNAKTYLEVKFSRGSVESELSTLAGIPFDNTGIDLLNHPKRFIQNGQHWKDLGVRKITGEVIKHHDFYSQKLDNKRSIFVWLPKSYHQNKIEYPVLYMHDGENVFDPTTATFGTDWDIDGMMTYLIERGSVKEAIVVGVFSKNRMNEYDYYYLGDKYGEFLVSEVIPFIDGKYRTLKGRDNTFLMGSSMGAIISLTLLWRYPDIFSKAAGVSFPAFVHDRSIFKLIEEFSIPSLPISFYMDHGDTGYDEKYEPSAKEFYQLLQTFDSNILNLDYKIFPYADHTEADWARRSYIPLTFLLGK